MDLEIVLEMLDCNIQSSTSSVTFEATKIKVDTNDYDGQCTWIFEVLAENSDSSTKEVLLIDSTGTTIADCSITITGSGVKERFTANATMNLNDSYRVVLPATTSANQVAVSAARIHVRQLGASRTRVQIPLGGQNGTVATDVAAILDTRANTAYGQGTADRCALWNYVSGNWATLSGTNTFSFEGVLSCSGTGTTSASLYNATDGTQVTGSEITATAGTDILSRQESSFVTDANFITAKNYEIRIKASAGTARIHRAAFYIRLTALDSNGKLEVYRRFSRNGATAIGSAGTNDAWRQQITAARYSNPVYYHEACGRESTLGTVSPQLGQCGTGATADGANPIVSAVTSSDINFDSTTKAISRTSALTLTTDWRIAHKRTWSSGTLVWTHGILVISCSTGVWNQPGLFVKPRR